MARIRVVLRCHEGTKSTPTIFKSGELGVDLAQREISVDGGPIYLKRKDYELLRLFANHPEQLLTHRLILREIWGLHRRMRPTIYVC